MSGRCTLIDGLGLHAEIFFAKNFNPIATDTRGTKKDSHKRSLKKFFHQDCIDAIDLEVANQIFSRRKEYSE